ncbi:cupin domain-containing protein [Neisseriaceae bacterium CLB008]|nr:cupin domain-containing protein [Neisseriaceae bacterium]
MTALTPSTSFSLTDHLVALNAQDFSARQQDMAQKSRSDADWLIGIKAFKTTLSVHGDYWERHPKGDETLCLLEGALNLILFNAQTATEHTVPLAAGHAFIVPQGTWHRLSVQTPGRLLFITPVVGSEHAKVGSIEPHQPQQAQS